MAERVIDPGGGGGDESGKEQDGNFRRSGLSHSDQVCHVYEGTPKRNCSPAVALYDLCAQKLLFRNCIGATNVANVYRSREQCVCVCTKTKTVIMCFLMSLHLYMPQLAALVIADVSVCLGDFYPILNSMYLGKRGRNSASHC